MQEDTEALTRLVSWDVCDPARWEHLTLPAWVVNHLHSSSVHFSHSVVSNSVTPWTAARQASLSITNSRSLLKLMSFKSVMPSNYLILCRPLLLPPSIFPSIRVFSNESVPCIRWPKYCSFSFSSCRGVISSHPQVCRRVTQSGL